jgi:hypothetical protein
MAKVKKPSILLFTQDQQNMFLKDWKRFPILSRLRNFLVFTEGSCSLDTQESHIRTSIFLKLEQWYPKIKLS